MPKLYKKVNGFIEWMVFVAYENVFTVIYIEMPVENSSYLTIAL